MLSYRGFAGIGIGGFYERYFGHVYILPVVGLAGCFLLYILDLRRGWRLSMERLRSNVFTVVFLLHPTVCHWAFTAFACRRSGQVHPSPSRIAIPPPLI